MWMSAVAVGVLVLVGLVAWGVVASQRAGEVHTPANSVDGTGLVVGSGPDTVEVYLDFMCPHCKAFEDEAGATLTQMAKDGKIKLVYRPIAILDGASTTQYSTRSAGSAGCAADFDQTAAFVPALFARQPQEGSAGLSDDTLIEIGGSVGIVDPSFASCVRDGRYKSWATHNTDEAGKRGVTGTPTVYVNGKRVNADLAEINAAIQGS